MLGIDRIALRRQRASAVLVDVDTQDHIALGGDLRRDFKLQIGLAKLDRGRTAGSRDLVGQLLALLDQGLDLIRSDHAWTRDNLALAIGLQGRQLQIQKAVRGGAEERNREGCRVGTAKAVGRHIRRQIDKLRVVEIAHRCLLGLITDAVVIAAEGRIVVAAQPVAGNAPLQATQILAP